MAYVYRHIRLDKKEPFYVGIGLNAKAGTYPRAFYTKERSVYWHNIASKADYKVEIMLDELTWEDACVKEREFISLYGRSDKGLGTLVNQTDGGDGGAGVIVKPETKEKIRNYQLSLDKKGKPGKKWSLESIQKRSATVLGSKRTEEQKSKMRKPKLSKDNYSYPKLKVPCEVCGFMAQPAAIKRWHNTNCKNNK